jgi:hypothetical protein
MTGRFLLAVLLTLSMVGQILGQTSLAASTSVSPAAPVVPVAPVNLTNSFPGCALRPDNTNHIYYLCLAWQDPSGTATEWIVTVTPQPTTPGPYTSLFKEIYIPGLQPATAYTISIVGRNAAGGQSTPLTGTYTTDPTDAKTAPATKDLQNLACQNAISTTTLRKIITCQWGSPAILPSRIDVKARCIATGGKNKVIRRSLAGTATTVNLPVNRAQYTCYLEVFGVYLNHKANDGHGHKFVQTCNSASGCVKIQ